jgi:tetratricopeptide (TPR) repeat protein
LSPSRLPDLPAADPDTTEETVRLGGDPQALHTLGGVFQAQGRFDEAVEVLNQSYEILVGLGDLRSQAMVLNSLGGALHRQDRPAEALAAFQKSIQIGKELKDSRHLSMVYTNLGKALTTEKRDEEAAEELRKGFEIDLELKNRPGLVIVTPALIKVLQNLGRKEEALEHCRRALAVAPNDRTLLGLQKRLLRAPAGEPAVLVQRGVLKRIRTHPKGYRFAFVTPEGGGPDIYVQERRSGLINFHNLREGLFLEVEIEQGPQGPRAVRVKVLPPTSTSAP